MLEPFRLRSLMLMLMLMHAAPAASASPRELCDAFEAEAYAKDLARCPGLAERVERGRQQCRELLNFSTSQKRVRLDPAAARRCVDAQKAYAAAPTRPAALAKAVRDACDAAIVGLGKEGAACDSAFECGAGLACVRKPRGASRACAKALPRGAACDEELANGSALHALVLGLRGVCGPHAHCAPTPAGLACAPNLARGAACDAKVAGACGPGGRCGNGRCVDETLAAKGERCAASSECAAGLRCVEGSCAHEATSAGCPL